MEKNILETSTWLNVESMPIGWALMGWGLVCLFLGFWLVSRRRAARLDLALNDARLAAANMTARLEELDAARDSLGFERDKTAQLLREQAVLTTRLEERERALAEMRNRLENDFQAIASRTIGSAHEVFLQQASETFQKYQEKANSEASHRHKAVDELIRPMKETLVRYEAGLAEMRDHQKSAQGALTGQIEVLAKSSADIQAEAAKLSTALKSGPKIRGRWGEEQLRNVVEMTGLSAYCDFEEQRAVRDGDSTKLPDMVVRLPGKRLLAVDSKVSLNAYLDAVEQTDHAARKVLFTKHGEEIWTHVKSLASKNYAASLKKSGALDFVIMFIPGENFFAAALEARPTLFQEAFDRGVLMATPTTLIAILKSVAYGWRQEKATDNARKVADLASDLYDSMRRMGIKFSGLGKSLEQSVKRYNETIGTLEGTVMPKARRFSEYEMPGTESEIEVLEPLETDLRELRKDRDLITAPEELAESDQQALPLAE